METKKFHFEIIGIDDNMVTIKIQGDFDDDFPPIVTMKVGEKFHVILNKSSYPEES